MTLLVLDVGSSSVRALLFDEEARLLPGGVVRRAYRFAYEPEGAAVADPLALRGLVEACIDEALQLPAAEHIRAVGMATFVGNLLGVDAAGHALTPLYTYADSRATVDSAALSTSIHATTTHQRTGTIVHPAYHPAKLRWLARTHPELVASVVRWLDFGGYAYEHWFGHSVPQSYSVASWSGMLHREMLAWDADWLCALALQAGHFPALADLHEMQTGLAEPYATRWPALADVPFMLAVGDGAAANVGSGAVSSQQIALTVGTTAALRVITEETNPPVPPGLWCYRVMAQHHLIGGATSEGGGVYHWLRQTLSLPDDLEAQLLGREPGAHGLVMLPLLSGERSPGWSLNAVGALAGLRQSSTAVDIAQAALEGVAMRLAAIAEQLGGSAQEVLASGGALDSSPAWVQIIANALGRPLHLLGEPEATGRGAALLLLHVLDALPLDAHPPQIARVVGPQAGAKDAFERMRQRQRDLYAWVTSREWGK